jgi:hypothetical protein
MIYYSALRTSMVAAGIAQAKLQYTYTFLAYLGSCAASCSYDATAYSATYGWAADATCASCYVAAYAAATAAQLEGYYYTLMKVWTLGFLSQLYGSWKLGAPRSQQKS